MKKIILPFLVIALTSALAYAQQTTEKATTIIATQADSIGLKDKVLKLLADKDYTVVAGKIPTTITTAAKTLKNGARVHYIFQLKGADIILSGKLPVAGQASMSMTNQGKKGTPIANGWEEMEKLAKALGGEIRYTVQ